MGANANTLAQVDLYTKAAGTIAQTVGSFANARYEKQTNRVNAQIAEMQAQDAIQRGKSDEAKHRAKVQQTKSSQRASFAANGVALDEGSPLAVLVSTDYVGEVDAATIRENASREAWGHSVKASNYRAAADASNPYLAGSSTLLTGAGTVADKWYQYKERKII